MANTRENHAAEEWVRSDWLPRHLGATFRKAQVDLKTGGRFEFDAVSEDGEIVVAISTSRAKTSGGKSNTGAVHKIRGDAYFLLLAEAERRILCFTDESMADWWRREANRKRLDPSIDLMHAELPTEIRGRIEATWAASSQEAKPSVHPAVRLI